MPRASVVFERNEVVMGHDPRGEFIKYKINLTIKDSGKTPVQMKLTFVPPHPFDVNMPENKTIKATSITQAYVKLNKFLNSYNFQMRSWE
jgi:hypothetical protein